ncbi:uncharacterized protein MONOS_6355 [Monocercomonoides exilis]|uniref:uncharacterized protein n=1 Tax=Monocercomonoides exilis TaxID=2049356 RepID=UPI00355A0255|nr:hypothetical protein MONOS_6355 [Monocercomonoides exilis]
MSAYNDEDEDEVQNSFYVEQFLTLFDELEHCSEIEQKKKVEEMNEAMKEMNKEEFGTMDRKNLFEEVNKMIEEKKMTMKNSLLLLKYIGCFVNMKMIRSGYFFNSLLCQRLTKTALNEEKKKKNRDEKLQIDIIECYFLLLDYYDRIPKELLTIYVKCLLKYAANKEENEEVQKDVEMVLLALGNIGANQRIEKGLYLNEIKEIIKYHQEHHNLTQLACQSAWQFLIYRFQVDRNLEDAIVNELHFVKEATRELEELVRSLEWKREKEEKKEKKEKKERSAESEIMIIERWLRSLDIYFFVCKYQTKEHEGLVECVVRVFWATRACQGSIARFCFQLFHAMIKSQASQIDCLVDKGAIGVALSEVVRSEVAKEEASGCLCVFRGLAKRLSVKSENEREEAKRKELKRKVIEMMEEEGYEDWLVSFI